MLARKNLLLKAIYHKAALPAQPKFDGALLQLLQASGELANGAALKWFQFSGAALSWAPENGEVFHWFHVSGEEEYGALFQWFQLNGAEAKGAVNDRYFDIHFLLKQK
ncbi:hypothetical protein BpHYR1_000888 [Brachionus plicatilis]|uniref:Uncharacterized protein n=1 Tax=Brachionus plicatilis TaxID=10195 RepID=A0A3M7SFT5_BRAPC|nr:hypothetical protein BpHYR1_000888 [Brachionus plicatilis]